MSNLGRKPIVIPEDVKVTIEGNNIKVSGPKGELEYSWKLAGKVKINDNLVKIIPQRKDQKSKSLWGLTRTRILNMIAGVKNGFEKQLELRGVGFKAEVSQNKLIMKLGFSHPVEIKALEGIEVKVEKNKIIISGIDKQKVGQFAASVRAIKPPEPYKGKGIKYLDEIVRKKPGKTIAKTEGEKT